MRTNPEAPKKQAGISFILVEMNTPGITVRPIKLIDGSYEVNEVFFENVRVPADQLVGEENKGWAYAKFLLGNERTGIARVGTTSCGCARPRSTPRKIRSAAARLLEDPLFAARVAEVENELLALELTQLRVSGDEADGKPNPASSMLKLRGSELQQAVTELLMEVAGPDALPFDAGANRLAGLGAARRAEVPQLPQDLHLRRHERGAAHHHRLHHPRIVRRGHGFRTDRRAAAAARHHA